MKLWSKEALSLGGIYCVLDTPFSLSGIEFVSGILFVIFLICAVMLCFNKTPKFVSFTISHYPKTSYYLASIGWIPYFAVIGIIALLMFSGIFQWADDTIITLVYIFDFICIVGLLVSPAVAFIRAKCNTNRLEK